MAGSSVNESGTEAAVGVPLRLTLLAKNSFVFSGTVAMVKGIAKD